MIYKISYTVCLLLAINMVSFSQKKPLEINDYKQWKRIESPLMSEDGKWIIYRYTFIDAEQRKQEIPITYLYNTHTNKEYAYENVSQMSFFNNGKCIKYTRKKESSTCNQGKDSIFLVSLKDMKRYYWDKEYGFNESHKSPMITYSYSLSPDLPEKRLVLWNFEKKDSIFIDSIGRYRLFNKEKSVIYIKNSDIKSLIIREIGGRQVVLYQNDTMLICDFTLHNNEKEVILAVASDSTYKDNPDLLFLVDIQNKSEKLLLDWKKIDLPNKYTFVGRTYTPFNDNNSLYVDLKPTIKTETPEVIVDTTIKLEIWRWNDELSPTRQSGRYRETQSLKYIYHIKENKLILITDTGSETVHYPHAENYQYVIISDNRPYKKYSDWKDEIGKDLYLVDINTGRRELIFKDFLGKPEWSPNGKYALFYHKTQRIWYSLNVNNQELKDISTAIGFPVYNEKHDKPSPPNPYGIAGWSEDGNTVYIYDKYDIWSINLDTQKLYSYTNHLGRKNNIRYRILNSDSNAKTIDIKKPLLLKSLNIETLDQGIYQLTLNKKLKKLYEGPYSFYFYSLSKDEKYCLYQRQNFNEFRDIWFSKTDFKNPRQITTANPQQENYLWGTVELIEWQNYYGNRNRGLLYFPENYDNTKKYPVIVTFYETHTEGIHTYCIPDYSNGLINTISYLSDDYIVFMPDIHFTLGEPGESSYNAVISGVQMLIDKGIADKEKIGLQGHSWSGYQAAYLVTRTDIFRCASPGAAVSNMVSAYTGIRTGSGMPRMFMYEETQSRMGFPLWGKGNTEEYIKNSPIYHADKITTPLLIFHCDDDEAVPYSEGLNLFLAMKRLQKPAWLLNYKGEKHFLSSTATQRDWTIRLKEFFDYYLKDAHKPEWMNQDN